MRARLLCDIDIHKEAKLLPRRQDGCSIEPEEEALHGAEAPENGQEVDVRALRQGRGEQWRARFRRLKRLDLVEGALRAPEPGAPSSHHVTTREFLAVFGLAACASSPISSGRITAASCKATATLLIASLQALLIPMVCIWPDAGPNCAASSSSSTRTASRSSRRRRSSG
jgi:hypothetical protein